MRTVRLSRCSALTRSSVRLELQMASYIRRSSRRRSISAVSTSTTAPVEAFHSFGCDTCDTNNRILDLIITISIQLRENTVPVGANDEVCGPWWLTTLSS